MNRPKVQHSPIPKLPKKKLVTVNFVIKNVPCPYCGRNGFKHSPAVRTIKGLKRNIKLICSKYKCSNQHHWTHNPEENPDTGKYPKGWKFLKEVRMHTINLIKSGNTLEEASADLYKKHSIDAGPSTIHDWVIWYDGLDRKYK